MRQPHDVLSLDRHTSFLRGHQPFKGLVVVQSPLKHACPEDHPLEEGRLKPRALVGVERMNVTLQGWDQEAKHGSSRAEPTTGSRFRQSYPRMSAFEPDSSSSSSRLPPPSLPVRRSNENPGRSGWDHAAESEEDGKHVVENTSSLGLHTDPSLKEEPSSSLDGLEFRTAMSTPALASGERLPGIAHIDEQIHTPWWPSRKDQGPRRYSVQPLLNIPSGQSSISSPHGKPRSEVSLPPLTRSPRFTQGSHPRLPSPRSLEEEEEYRYSRQSRSGQPSLRTAPAPFYPHGHHLHSTHLRPRTDEMEIDESNRVTRGPGLTSPAAAKRKSSDSHLYSTTRSSESGSSSSYAYSYDGVGYSRVPAENHERHQREEDRHSPSLDARAMTDRSPEMGRSNPPYYPAYRGFRPALSSGPTMSSSAFYPNDRFHPTSSGLVASDATTTYPSLRSDSYIEGQSPLSRPHHHLSHPQSHSHPHSLHQRASVGYGNGIHEGSHGSSYDVDSRRNSYTDGVRHHPYALPSHSHAHSPAGDAPTSRASSPAVPRRRGKLPKPVTDLLKSWLLDHASHPYPTEDEKRRLCSMTGLSISQVSNWFINARRRILVPQGSGNFALGNGTAEQVRDIFRPSSTSPHHHGALAPDESP